MPYLAWCLRNGRIRGCDPKTSSNGGEYSLFIQIFGVVGVHDELNPFWVVDSVAEESEVKFRIVD
jgi:hypothetical protein